MPLNFTSVYVPLLFISALLGQDGAIMERASHAGRVPVCAVRSAAGATMA